MLYSDKVMDHLNNPRNVGELEKHKNKPVIVVDGSGMQCQDSATALIKAGFEQVSVLKDGVAGWSGENLPLVRGK